MTLKKLIKNQKTDVSSIISAGDDNVVSIHHSFVILVINYVINCVINLLHK